MFGPASARSAGRAVHPCVPAPMRLCAALIVTAVAASARADSVSNLVVVSSTQATESNPRSTVFTDMLNGSFDVVDDWTLSAGASVTLQGETPAAENAHFGESGSAVTLFSAGADWSATDQLTIGLTFDVSPTSTQFAGTPVTLANGSGGEAQVRSRTSQFAGAIEISEVNGPDIKSENTFDATTVKTSQKSARADGKKFRYSFPPHSYTMLKAKFV